MNHGDIGDPGVPRGEGESVMDAARRLAGESRKRNITAICTGTWSHDRTAMERLDMPPEDTVTLQCPVCGVSVDVGADEGGEQTGNTADGTTHE